jgi:hypothetical protein
VLLDAVAQALKVTLTASFDGVSLMADVRVLGAAELPVLVSLTPPAANVAPTGTVELTVTLDIPAPAGGTVVALSLDPANAGTIPPTVTVPAGMLSASFDYVDGGVVMGATVTATLDAQSFMSTLTVLQVQGGLVINEVDYDTIGTDNDEFVEIYNGSGAPVNLADYALVLVNGSNNTVYLDLSLAPAGMLADKQYLVVGSSTVMAAAGALKIDFAAASNNVQNGSPDGIALVNVTTSTLVDALAYEGAMTMASIPALGTVSLVEGTALPVRSRTATWSPARSRACPTARTPTTPASIGSSAPRPPQARSTCPEKARLRRSRFPTAVAGPLSLTFPSRTVHQCCCAGGRTGSAPRNTVVFLRRTP